MLLMPKQPGKLPSGKAPPKPQDVGIAPDATEDAAPAPASKTGELAKGEDQQRHPSKKS
jgi:hypothetical protein